MRESSRRKPLRLVRRPDGSLAAEDVANKPEVASSPANKNHSPKDLSAILGMSDDGTPLDENGNPIKKEKKFDWDETKELAGEYFRRYRKLAIFETKKLVLKAKKKIKKNPSKTSINSSETLKTSKSTNNPNGTKRIEIALTLPDTKKLKQKSKAKLSKLSKRQKIAASIIAVFLVVGFVGIKVFSGDKPAKTNDQSVLSSNNSKIPLNVTPEFKVLVPADKRMEDLGGFAKVSPPNSAAAYAYVDEVGEARIKLTQQQLPQQFKDKPVTELEKLAKNYNATKLIQINEVAAYVGKSEKGPQTLIFAKDDLLVFAVADQELEEIQWVQYVSGLKKQ